MLLSVVLALMASGASGCHSEPPKPAPSALHSVPTETSPPDAGFKDASLGNIATVTSALPEAVLSSIVGCWQLDDRERWAIERTDAGGARVLRTLLTQREQGGSADYAHRAALPSKILFNPAEHTLAFSTAGPVHGLLFVFTVNAQELQGSWGTSRAPGSGYHSLNSRVVLHRC